MSDHTDKAAIRCVIAGVTVLLFVLIVWGPVDTLWIAPWLYEGTELGNMAWRKAWVFNGWITFAPFLVAFSYCGITMPRAIRRDASERERGNRE